MDICLELSILNHRSLIGLWAWRRSITTSSNSTCTSHPAWADLLPYLLGNTSEKLSKGLPARFIIPESYLCRAISRWLQLTTMYHLHFLRPKIPRVQIQYPGSYKAPCPIVATLMSCCCAVFLLPYTFKVSSCSIFGLHIFSACSDDESIVSRTIKTRCL